jgi:hypothetical protein
VKNIERNMPFSTYFVKENCIRNFSAEISHSVRYRYRWEHNIEVNLEKIRVVGEDWTEVAVDSSEDGKKAQTFRRTLFHTVRLV